MNFQQMKTSVKQMGKDTMQKVNHIAKLERFIAAVLIFTPLILYLVDLRYQSGFRDSISNYFFMHDSHWFGFLLTLAAMLFVFNGVQHLSVQDKKDVAAVESRFGKGYNIIFGLSLLGVLFFNHIDYKILHYIFAVVFFVGCALAMLLTRETRLKRLGDVFGILTLLPLAVYLVLEYLVLENNNSYTLLIAEWIGLFFIAIYFIAESIERDKREVAAGLY